ncbi:helix-turn-helix domain-containing protein [Paenibacillus solani]|uniref:helix-turn-helix domain-containing protein n=1 Tax=Paenibacillus solani TaxID=1705565 RepID=UPI003D2C3756
MLLLKLDKIMEEKGLNSRQLSEMTGIRWNTIDDMKKNKAKHWAPDNLEKVMVALGIKDIEDLIEYKEDSE